MSRFLLALGVSVSSCMALLTDVVHTTTGPIKGKVNLLEGTHEFLGIPFAEPPLGDLRFANPVPIAPWTKTKETTKLGHQCPQFDFIGNIHIGHEDCLGMDIYVPAKPSVKGPLPVYFWLYGGGWILGDKNEFGVYDPYKSFLKNKDIIFVAPNYRLHTLGFLAMEELKGTEGSIGNQALLDQQVALKWVHDNIAAFGGDPSRITIGGESAGAFSTCWHLASPGSQGLFSAAIMESGTCDAPQFFRDLKDAESFSEAVALSLGCEGTPKEVLECMRKVPVPDLISEFPRLKNYTDTYFIPALYPAMPWAAAIDGKALPAMPLTAIKKNPPNAALLIGTNEDEGNLFTFFLPKQWENMWRALLTHYFPDEKMLAEVKQFYNISDDLSPKEYKRVCSHVLTTYFFTCSSRRVVREIAKTQDAYLYQFTFTSGFVESLIGDAHALEVPFVFGHPGITGGVTIKDHEMSNLFVHFWTNFVKNQDPNNPSNANKAAPVWNKYTTQENNYMDMDVPAKGSADLLASECDFWDQFAGK